MRPTSCSGSSARSSPPTTPHRSAADGWTDLRSTRLASSNRPHARTPVAPRFDDAAGDRGAVEGHVDMAQDASDSQSNRLELAPGCDAELAIRARKVDLDGLGGDEQLLRDRLVRVAGRGQG